MTKKSEHTKKIKGIEEVARHLPPVYGTVLAAQYEDSSCLHEWISAQM